MIDYEDHVSLMRNVQQGGQQARAAYNWFGRQHRNKGRGKLTSVKLELTNPDALLQDIHFPYTAEGNPFLDLFTPELPPAAPRRETNMFNTIVEEREDVGQSRDRNRHVTVLRRRRNPQ